MKIGLAERVAEGLAGVGNVGDGDGNGEAGWRRGGWEKVNGDFKL